ncbi:RnfB [Desulforapulum autotrophicum HRM2]|uniref:Ion-translocating oxidoreductase complex subunit B n=1 Tax=Desulforapulum autotrophicum (strain ATCC 43914 / DSM 3382 / VKM B-1955 / HRM2) TaxID=177437 RepID=C0QFQ9_DESAH|nr:RnfABCDGE type electron transport complex subunit B [Desulforapulum autotrophicum]ACN15477.1 RnfB [Desulforapulum autotrophicum HRM2]
MIEITIGIAAGTMLGMAVIMSYILGWANKKFHVEVDARVEAVIETLPGANCGGCGYLGCSEYAVAIVTDNAPVNKCPVGGEACALAVGAIMGVEVGETIPHRAVVHCGATLEDRLGRTEYKGERRCAAATLVAGVQGCTFGCLGFGDCVEACKYDAIHVEDGLAVVNYDHCIGCGACVKACPRSIITMADFHEPEIPMVLCSNRDKGKDVTQVCNKGCIGCKACVKVSELFTMNKDLAVADHDAFRKELADNALEAVEKCPKKCIGFIGKKAV